MISAIRRFKQLKNSPILRKFIAHNQKVFIEDAKCKSQCEPVVLFELNFMHSSLIACSYLANIVAVEYNAKIVAYIPRIHANQKQRFVFAIKKFLGLQEFAVHKSFGSTDFLAMEITDSQRDKAHNIFSEIVKNLRDKRNIEEVTINGVWVGDLIYDTYLRNYNKPTIDKSSTHFQTFLKESVETFVYWEDYFNSHDVQAINVSHCCYNLAMPLRLAVDRNIPAYQASLTHLYRLNKSNYFAYSDFRYFPEIFSALPEAAKKAGIAEAQRRVGKRFAGEVGVDMAYSTKSAYGIMGKYKLLRETSQKKILIAAHCFFDSPHGYGINIFPDFYEWLDFLGKITEVTDYDWYIKTHPDYHPGTKEVIDSFITKYPKFTLLPANASHHQIIAEGINLALTVLGTIGFEYAALGIPVINCSMNNPHIAYNFNMHPKDEDEYRHLLLNLDTLEFNTDNQHVYEYYFMQHIYNIKNLFFADHEATIEALGGYSAQFTDAVYEKWLDEWTPDKHQSIKTAIQTYIRSGDFRMDYSHFGSDFAAQSTASKL
jgi:hypothetical protein